MRITTEQVLDCDLIDVFFRLYESSCAPLRQQAAARHVLSQEEFSGEMRDARIDKFIVWDNENVPVGLTTLTADLSAISWISPEFYTSRFPAAAARGALFYLGYILVDRRCRHTGAFLLMTDRVNRHVANAGGVLGYDICSYNDAHGIGRFAERLLSRSERIERLDTQSYYSADYQSPPR